MSKKKTIQAKIATFGGDIWIPNGIKSLIPPWPFSPILYGYHHKETTGLDYRCLVRLMKPGDLLLCYAKEFKLSNSNIKATVFKHLAIYTGPIHGVFNQETHQFSKVRSVDNDEYKQCSDNCKGYFDRTVTHATSDGVVVEDFYDFMHSYDKIAVLRPTQDLQKQKVIVNTALENVGLDYNFDFKPDGPKAYYCTELGIFCLQKANLPIPEPYNINVSWKGFLPWNWFSKKHQAPVYLADDFCTVYPMVCTTVSCDDSDFWSESRHADELRKAIQGCPDARTIFN